MFVSDNRDYECERVFEKLKVGMNCIVYTNGSIDES